MTARAQLRGGARVQGLEDELRLARFVQRHQESGKVQSSGLVYPRVVGKTDRQR